MYWQPDCDLDCARKRCQDKDSDEIAMREAMEKFDEDRADKDGKIKAPKAIFLLLFQDKEKTELECGIFFGKS